MNSFVKNEITLQYSLSRTSNHIVKIAPYTEDEIKYNMIMEYSEDPCYFEDMLENVLLSLLLEIYFCG